MIHTAERSREEMSGYIQETGDLAGRVMVRTLRHPRSAVDRAMTNESHTQTQITHTELTNAYCMTTFVNDDTDNPDRMPTGTQTNPSLLGGELLIAPIRTPTLTLVLPTPTSMSMMTASPALPTSVPTTFVSTATFSPKTTTTTSIASSMPTERTVMSFPIRTLRERFGRVV